MTLKRALLTATILFASAAPPLWAQQGAGDGGAIPGQQPIGGHQPTGLLARQPLPKRAVIVKPDGESRLIVKFTDAVKARPNADGLVDFLNGPQPEDAQLEAIINQYNLRFIPAIRTPAATVDEILNRAATRTRKAQPDLLGLMYIEGNDRVLETAARAINQLDCVEYIYFETPLRPAGDPTGACCVPISGGVNCVDDVTQDICEQAGGQFQGDGSTCGVGTCDPDLGACCIDDETCVALTEVQCDGLGGGFRGVGSNCVQDEVNCSLEGCGEPGVGDCFIPAGLPGNDDEVLPWCDEEECCDLVGDFRPFCIDENGVWDEICVAIAHLFCEAPPADRCSSFLNGSCFEAHTTGGCIDNGCCNIVCALDSFCCESNWDEGCVDLARDECIDPNAGGPTPDLTAIQGYLRAVPYVAQPGGVPPGLTPPAPSNVFGYAGHGLNLFSSSVLTDTDALTGDARYVGLYGLGRQLLEEYGIGTQNLTRGRTIKVAVIEWSFFAGHEDLDVTPEPGQTMITILDVGFPDHATACLGIIGAKENGFGMTGVAPDAKLYFFPLTSVEDGPREHTAWTNAIATLGAGDVISCSYSPGTNSLATVETTWTLIRLAADLGITACVSASNDCVNLDDREDFGDSGGIVVGAGTPGRNHSRLQFSNFYRDGDNGPDGNGNVVHVQGWGDGVASLAHSGNVRFPGGNWNRSYCSDFGGTSAAAPMVAGVVACLQGLAKQFYDVPLTPVQIRSAIQGAGFPQGGFPNPDDNPGFDDTAAPCGPDTDPEEEANKIGAFPRPERSGFDMLNQNSFGFDQSPLVDDVLVIRGIHRAGNRFSLKASDNNYFVVDSLYTFRKHRPHIPGPASRVTYMGTGEVADIMVTGHVDTVPHNITISIETAPPGVPSFHFIEIYDWTIDRWSFVGFSQFGEGEGQGDVTEEFTAFNAPRFVNRDAGNQVLVRSYVLGLGLTPPYTMRWDFVNLEVFQGFGGGGGQFEPPTP